jgi:hypothetical protein
VKRLDGSVRRGSRRAGLITGSGRADQRCETEGNTDGQRAVHHGAHAQADEQD